MGNLRKKLVVLSLIFVSAFAIFYGCNNDVYKKLKLDLSESYKEVILDDKLENNTFSITANVSGRPKGYNGAVSFSVPTNESIEHVRTYDVEKGSTTAVFYAKKPGIVEIQVVTLEGNKSEKVTVKVIKQINGLSFNSNYIPVVKGVETEIANFLNFSPYNTNQTDVKLELIKQGSPDLINIIVSGSKITVPNNVNIDEFDIIARSTVKDTIFARTKAKVIEMLTTDQMPVMYDNGTPGFTEDDTVLTKSRDQFYLDLASNTPDLHEKNVYINFNNSDVEAANYIVEIENLSADGSILDNNGNKKGIVQIDITNGIYTIKGVGNGEEKIKFIVSRADFPDYVPFKQEIILNVKVQAYPTSINVTDGKNKLDKITIYSNYDNPNVLFGSTIKLDVLNEDNVMPKQDVILSLSGYEGYVTLYDRFKQPVEFNKATSADYIYYLKHTFKDAPASLNLIITSATYNQIIKTIPIEIITHGVDLVTDTGQKEGKLAIDLNNTDAVTLGLGGLPGNFDYRGLTVATDNNLVEVIKQSNLIAIKHKNQIGKATIIITAPNGSFVTYSVEFYESLNEENSYLTIAGQVVKPEKEGVTSNYSVNVKNGLTISVKFTINGKSYDMLPDIINYAVDSSDRNIVKSQSGYKLVTGDFAGSSVVTISLTGYDALTGEKTKIVTYKIKINVQVPVSAINVNSKEVTIYDTNTLSSIQQASKGNYTIILDILPINASCTFNDLNWKLEYNGTTYNFDKSKAQIVGDEYIMTLRVQLTNVTLRTKVSNFSQATISCALPSYLSNDSFKIIARVDQKFVNENGVEMNLPQEASVKFYVEKPKQVEYFVFDNISSETIDNDKIYYVDFDERDLGLGEGGYDGYNLDLEATKKVINFEVYPSNAFYKDLNVYSPNESIGVSIDNLTKKITIKAIKPLTDMSKPEVIIKVYSMDSVDGVGNIGKYIEIKVTILNGTAGAPFKISNVQDLKRINKSLSAHYVLVNNINVGEWTPIGYDPSITPAPGIFTGELSGSYEIKDPNDSTKVLQTNQYSINNMVITNSALYDKVDYYGLFAIIGESGFVHDLIINNFYVYVNINRSAELNNNIYVGAVAGYSEGKIKNVSVNDASGVENFNGTYYSNIKSDSLPTKGIRVNRRKNLSETTIPTNYFVGGIVGFVNNTKLEDVNDASKVLVKKDDNGGLAKDISSKLIKPEEPRSIVGLATIKEDYIQIENVKVTTQINVYTLNDCISYVGGIVGFNNKAVISNTNTNFNSYGINGSDIIVAINPNTIVTAAESVNTNSAFGGAVGYNNGIVNGYKIKATIFGGYETDNQFHTSNVGGAIGYNTGTVTNNTSIPLIRGYKNIGGLIGKSENTITVILENNNPDMPDYDKINYVNGIHHPVNISTLDRLNFNKKFIIKTITYSNQVLTRDEHNALVQDFYGVSASIANDFTKIIYNGGINDGSILKVLTKDLIKGTEDTDYIHKLNAGSGSAKISGGAIVTKIGSQPIQLISVEEIVKLLASVNNNLIQNNKVEFIDSSDAVILYNTSIIGFDNVGGLIGSYEGLNYAITNASSQSVFPTASFVGDRPKKALTVTNDFNFIKTLEYNSVYNYLTGYALINKYGNSDTITNKDFYGNILLTNTNTAFNYVNNGGGLVGLSKNAYLTNNITNVNIQGNGSNLGGLIGSALGVTQVTNSMTLGNLIDVNYNVNTALSGKDAPYNGSLVGNSTNVKLTQLLYGQVENVDGAYNYVAHFIPNIIKKLDADNNIVYVNHNNINKSYSKMIINGGSALEFAGNNKVIINNNVNDYNLKFKYLSYVDTINDNNNVFADDAVVNDNGLSINRLSFNIKDKKSLTNPAGNQNVLIPKLGDDANYGTSTITKFVEPNNSDLQIPNGTMLSENSVIVKDTTSISDFKHFNAYTVIADYDHNGINDADQVKKVDGNTVKKLFSEVEEFFKNNNYNWYSSSEVNDNFPLLLSSNRIKGNDSKYYIDLLSNIPPTNIIVNINQNYVNTWFGGINDNVASTIYHYSLADDSYAADGKINFGNNADLTNSQLSIYTNKVQNDILKLNTYSIEEILNVVSVPSFVGASNTFVSSNPNILSISRTDNNEIKFIANNVGTAYITVSSAYNTSLSKTVKINVVNAINNLNLNYNKSGINNSINTSNSLTIQKSTLSNPFNLIINTSLKGVYNFAVDSINKNFNLNENTTSGVRYYLVFGDDATNENFGNSKIYTTNDNVNGSAGIKINNKPFVKEQIYPKIGETLPAGEQNLYVHYVDVPAGDSTNITGLTADISQKVFAVPYIDFVANDGVSYRTPLAQVSYQTTTNSITIKDSIKIKNNSNEIETTELFGIKVPENHSFYIYDENGQIKYDENNIALRDNNKYINYLSNFVKLFNIKVKNASFGVEKSVDKINFFVNGTPTFDINVLTDEINTVLYLTYVDNSGNTRSIALSEVVDITLNGVKTKTLQNKLQNNKLKIGNLTLKLNRIDTSSFADSNIVQKFIRYSFELEVEDEDKMNVQEAFNRNFNFFIVKDNANIVFDNNNEFITSDLVDSVLSNTELPVVLNPQSIVNISLKHYPKGELTNDSNGNSTIGNISEEAYLNIIPGNAGLLKINVSPAFSSFDNIVLTSNSVNGSNVWFNQMYANMQLSEIDNAFVQNGTYQNLNNTTDLNGTITLNKISNLYPNKSTDFDGFIYVKTLVNSFVTEGSAFILTATAYKNGVAVQSNNIILDVQTPPGLNLSVVGGGKSAPIARGTELNFNATLNGVSGEIDFTESYAYRIVNGIERNIGNLGSVFSINKTESGYQVDSSLSLNQSNYIKIIGKVAKQINGETYYVRDSLKLKVADYVIDEIGVENVINGKFDGLFNQTYPLIVKVEKATYSSSIKDLVKEQIAKLEKELSSAKEITFNGKNDRLPVWFSVENNTYNSVKPNSYNDAKTYYIGNRGYEDFNNELVYTLQNTRFNSGDRLAAVVSYTYTESGVVAITTKSLKELYSGDEFKVEQSKEFDFGFYRFRNENQPEPIATVNEFINMQDGVDYILVSDLTLENWVPFVKNINSLDGNGYVITLKSFKLDSAPDNPENLIEHKNIGIFEKVSPDTILKNIIVEVKPDRNAHMTNEQADKTSYIGDLNVDAKAYKNVTFGVLAGENSGIITNAQITYDANRLKLDRELKLARANPNSPDYKAYWLDGTFNEINFLADFRKNVCPEYSSIIKNADGSYSFNIGGSRRDLSVVKIETTVTTAAQNHFMGLLVGSNTTGTDENNNSRVGYITNSSVDDISINGVGYVAGFVANNNGKISSSYFKGGNVINRTNESNASVSATGGFVVFNDGEDANIQYSYVEGRLGDGNDFRLSGDIKPSDSADAINNIVRTRNANSDKTGLTSQIKLGYAGAAYNNAGYNGTDEEKLAYLSLVGSLRAMNSAISSTADAAAFIYENNGYISNSYANILVKSSLKTSGFVYSNEVDGKIDGCFTLSSVLVDNMAASPFTGRNSQYDYNNVTPNSITDSHYLKIGNGSTGDSKLESDYADKFIDENEIATSLGASQFDEYNTFQGFAFNTDFTTNSFSEVSRAVWFVPNVTTSIYTSNFKSDSLTYSPYVKGGQGVSFYTLSKPQLVAANLKTQSIRQWKGDETSLENSYDYISAPIGGKLSNPILIKTAEDFNSYLAYDNKINIKDAAFAIRFVSDIAFNKTDLKANTYSINYFGDFDGNGMNIDELRLVSDTDFESDAQGNKIEYLGLFGKIITQPVDGENPRKGVVRNINISVDEVRGSKVTHVGALAGAIENANVFNVNITGSEVIQGKNIVGGLAGIITGDSEIVNITSSLSAKASYFKYPNLFSVANSGLLDKDFGSYEIYNYETDNGVTEVKNAETISYVGGIAGIFDVQKRAAEETNKLSLFNAKARSLTVNGSVNLIAEIVGGVFGLVGSNATTSDLQFIIDDNANPTLTASRVAGGLVGENRGSIERSYIAHSSTTQKTIDNEYKATALAGQSAAKYAIVNKGYNGLFTGNAHFIGGVIGFNNGGTITNSYSKANVINLNSLYAGGFIGANAGGKISLAYTTGSVSAFRSAGGFIGMQTIRPGVVEELSRDEESVIIDKNVNKQIAEKLFLDTTSNNINSNNLTNAKTTLSNIVVANVWREADLKDDRTVNFNKQTVSLGTLIGRTYMNDYIYRKKPDDSKKYEKINRTSYNLSEVFDNMSDVSTRKNSESIFFVQPYINMPLNTNGGDIGINLPKLMSEIGMINSSNINDIKTINSGNYIENDIRFTRPTSEDSFKFAGESGKAELGTAELIKKNYIYSRLQNIGSARTHLEVFATDIIATEAKANGDPNTDVWNGIINNPDSYVKTTIFGKWEKEIWTGVNKESDATTADLNTAYPFIEAKPIRSRVNVYTAKDLEKMKSYRNAEFILQNDIDINSSQLSVGNAKWEPIGTMEEPFAGSLHSQRNSDGTYNNFAIYDSAVENARKGLTQPLDATYSTFNDTNKYVGLLGVVDDASFNNFTLRDIVVKANTSTDTDYSYVGTIFGYSDTGANISYINAHDIAIDSTKAITAGGLAGYANNSRIASCLISNLKLNISNFGNLKEFKGKAESLFGFGGAVGIIGSDDKVKTTVSDITTNNVNINISNANSKVLINKTNLPENFKGKEFNFGGIVGKVNTDLTNESGKIAGLVTNDSELIVKVDFADENTSNFNDVNIGGLVGSAKDASIYTLKRTGTIANTDYAVKNQVVGGSLVVDINKFNATVNVGGALGKMYGVLGNNDIDNITTGNDISYNYNVLSDTVVGKANIGGVVGNADNSKVSNLTRENKKLEVGFANNSGSTVGGLIGKVNNCEVINNCLFNGLIDARIVKNQITEGNSLIAIGGAFGNVDMATNTTDSNIGKISKIISNGSSITVNQDKTNLAQNNSCFVTNIGGLIGNLLNGKVSESISNTNIINLVNNVKNTNYNNYKYNLGGLIGFIDLNKDNALISGSEFNNVSVENCYSTGQIEDQLGLINNNNKAGLLVGGINYEFRNTDKTSVTLKNNYAIGSFIYDKARVYDLYENANKGGILGGFTNSGKNTESNTTVSLNYKNATANYELSTNLVFVNNVFNRDFVPYCNNYGTTLTTEQMLFNATTIFKQAENSDISVWNSEIWTVENNSYPQLKWINESADALNTEPNDGFTFIENGQPDDVKYSLSNSYVLTTDQNKLNNSISYKNIAYVQEVGSYVRPSINEKQIAGNYILKSDSVIYSDENIDGSSIALESNRIYFKKSENGFNNITFNQIDKNSIIYGLNFTPNSNNSKISTNSGLITHYSINNNNLNINIFGSQAVLTTTNNGIIFNGVSNNKLSSAQSTGFYLITYYNNGIIDTLNTEFNSDNVNEKSFSIAQYNSKLIKNTALVGNKVDNIGLCSTLNSNGKITNSYVMKNAAKTLVATIQSAEYGSGGSGQKVLEFSEIDKFNNGRTKVIIKIDGGADEYNGIYTFEKIYNFLEKDFDLINTWTMINAKGENESELNYGLPLLQHQLKNNWFDEKYSDDYYWSKDDLGKVSQTNSKYTNFNSKYNDSSVFTIDSVENLAFISSVTNYGFDHTVEKFIATKVNNVDKTKDYYNNSFTKVADSINNNKTATSYSYKFGVLTKEIKVLYDFADKKIKLDFTTPTEGDNVEKNTVELYNKLWTPIGFGVDNMTESYKLTGDGVNRYIKDEVVNSSSDVSSNYSNMFRGKIDGGSSEIKGMNVIVYDRNAGLFGSVNPKGAQDASNSFASNIVIKQSNVISLTKTNGETSAGMLAGFVYVNENTHITNKVGVENVHVISSGLASGLVGNIGLAQGQNVALTFNKSYVNGNILSYDKTRTSAASGLAYLYNGSNKENGPVTADEFYFVGKITSSDENRKDSLLGNNANNNGHSRNAYSVYYKDEKAMEGNKVLTDSQLRRNMLYAFDWAATWVHIEPNTYPVFSNKADYWIKTALEEKIVGGVDLYKPDINEITKTITVKPYQYSYVDIDGNNKTINQPQQLAWIANQVLLGNYNGFEGYTVNITGSMDFGGKVWTPIGYYSDKDDYKPFKGTLTSATARELSNIMSTGVYENAPGSLPSGVNSVTNNSIGLFGYTENATIENVNITSGMMFGEEYVGAIVGYAKSTNILNCINGKEVKNADNTINKEESSTIVSGYKNVGGLVGYFENTASIALNFNNNTNYANVQFAPVDGKPDNDAENFGGIIGSAKGIVNLIHNRNLVNVNGYNNVGGIIGIIDIDAVVTISYLPRPVDENIIIPDNSGNVTGNNYVGGIIGYSKSPKLTINSLRNTGFVTAEGIAGGIAGYTASSISLVVNEGDVKGDYAAGIVGEIDKDSMSDKKIVDGKPVLNSNYVVLNNILNKGKLTGSQNAGIAFIHDQTKMNAEMFGLAVGIGKQKDENLNEVAVKPIGKFNDTSYKPHAPFNGVVNSAIINDNNNILVYNTLKIDDKDNLVSTTLDIKYEDALKQNPCWNYVASNNIDIDYTAKNALANSAPLTQKIGEIVYSNITKLEEWNYIVWQIKTNFVNEGSTNKFINALYINNLTMPSSFTELSANTAYPLRVDVAGPTSLGSISISGVSGTPHSVFGYGYGNTVKNLQFNVNQSNSSNRYSNTGIVFKLTDGVILDKITMISNTYYTGENFGTIASNIYNSAITNVVVSGTINSDGDYIGGFVSLAKLSNINNCTNNAKITSESKNCIGGIASQITDTSITGSINSAAITGNHIVGGIVAIITNNKISSSPNSGLITAKGDAGGITGQTINASIENSNNTGKIQVTGASDKSVGGITGYSSGANYNNCTNGNTVTASNCYVGGIVGYLNGGEVKNSTNSSIIKGNKAIGGIVGYGVGSTINNCTATTTSIAGTTVVQPGYGCGGIIGFSENASGSGNISNGFAGFVDSSYKYTRKNVDNYPGSEGHYAASISIGDTFGNEYSNYTDGSVRFKVGTTFGGYNNNYPSVSSSTGATTTNFVDQFTKVIGKGTVFAVVVWTAHCRVATLSYEAQCGSGAQNGYTFSETENVNVERIVWYTQSHDWYTYTPSHKDLSNEKTSLPGLEQITVKYDYMDGKNVKTEYIVKGGTAENITPSREDYSFVAWYNDSALTSVFDFNTALTSNKTLYAKWTESNRNLVHFELEGGVGNSTIYDQAIKNGKTASEPKTDPTKSGVKFMGWYMYNYSDAVKFYNENASVVGKTFINFWNDSKFNFDNEITSNINLFAHWENAIVTYMNADASGNPTTKINTVYAGWGTKLTKPPTDPTLAGYVFDYWTLDGVEYNFALSPVVKDITLVAHYVKSEVTVRFFDENEVSVVSKYPNAVINKGTTLKTSDIAGYVEPTKTGYKFEGWFTQSRNSFVGSDADYAKLKFTFGVTIVNQNMNLYMHYTKQTFTVSFVDQVGNSNILGITYPSQTILYNETATRQNVEPVDGWTFKGWFTRAKNADESDAEYDAAKFRFGDESNPTLITANTNIYAYFAKIEFLVSFTQNDGSAIPGFADVSVQQGQPVDRPGTDREVDPTGAGRIFMGWYTISYSEFLRNGRPGETYEDYLFKFSDTPSPQPIYIETNIYGYWLPESEIKYNVKFVSQSGALLNDVANFTINYGETVTRPTVTPLDPSGENKLFQGWYTMTYEEFLTSGEANYDDYKFKFTGDEGVTAENKHLKIFGYWA